MREAETTAAFVALYTIRAWFERFCQYDHDRIPARRTSPSRLLKARERVFFLVATHSGYFTNRQFKSFAQTESGSVSHAFIRKLLDRKHASYHAYRSGGPVYHLFARKVYQAIERENLRTRKKHELEYVKTRLVA
jgi:hypothetical protein